MTVVTTAQYLPPAPNPGTVQLTMDETTAQKLLAVLGKCTGDHFDELYRAMKDTLPQETQLKLELGGGGSYDPRKAIPLHPASGAAFTLTHR